MTATTTTTAPADDDQPQSALATPEIEEWRGVSAEENDDISFRGGVRLRRGGGDLTGLRASPTTSPDGPEQ